MRTSSVPRATIRPRGRDDSLPSSSNLSISHKAETQGECRKLPLNSSFTSSNTRFISWS